MHRWSGLLTALIVDDPMCVACIAKHGDITEAAAEAALAVVESTLPVHRKSTVCGGCGAPGMVYFLARPSLGREKRSSA
jgi:hypothetical protein